MYLIGLFFNSKIHIRTCVIFYKNVYYNYFNFCIFVAFPNSKYISTFHCHPNTYKRKHLQVFRESCVLVTIIITQMVRALKYYVVLL